MTATLVETPTPVPAADHDGGLPARRAVARWAWRLFRREWRQQLLIVALVLVAVAATTIGATVAIDTRQPAQLGFGSAHYRALIKGSPAQVAKQVGALQQKVGQSEVILNQTLHVPGSIDTYQLRAQDPHGPYGKPMLQLVSGHFPTGASEAAITPELATELRLSVGDVWTHDGVSRRVVGIVQDPLSLLDEFILVAPGQVTAPTEAVVLFDHANVPLATLGPTVASAGSAVTTNAFNPTTIVLSLATIGMLFIALVSVGGFTVLAQRRMRSFGMLASVGATDRDLGMVVRVNGAIVGLVGAVGGAVLGVVLWLVYRPHAEATSHHLIGAFSLPWIVILPAMALAVVATFVAATWPARAVARVPIVTALAGRPAPPRKVRRSVVPGIIALGLGFVLLSAVGASNGGDSAALIFGLVSLVVAAVLLAPFCLQLLAMVTGHTPVTVRLATRDLSRYRARSGSALSAVSVAVLIAVTICLVASARYGDVLDYAGPNLASNQLIVSAPFTGGATGKPSIHVGPSTNPNTQSTAPAPVSPVQAAAAAKSIASGLAASEVVPLVTANATIVHPGRRQFSGQLYVATPQLLKAFGIPASAINPEADLLTMRPGLSGYSTLQLTSGGQPGEGPTGNSSLPPCPKANCIANPVIQEIGALPSGTSAPNTVVTERAVHQLGLQTSTTGWLVQTAGALSAAQIANARQLASATGVTVETKNDEPTSTEVLDWATVFAVLLALGVLAMSVGLIRSETSGDLRILSATGASSASRRTISAATAGALALLGALIGTAIAYVAVVAFLSSNQLDGLSELGNVPVRNLLIILVGMPILAVACGWLLSGRPQRDLGHQPIE